MEYYEVLLTFVDHVLTTLTEGLTFPGFGFDSLASALYSSDSRARACPFLTVFLVAVWCLVDYAAWYVHFEELDAYVTAQAQLSEVAESSRLADKMKISLSKKRRLVAKLEAAGEVEGAAKSLEHMKVIVARDAVTLGELETLLARAQVGVSLKAGFMADMEVKD
ncbi:hypothetical protein Tco_0902401 [Tanacetum coccineum]